MTDIKKFHKKWMQKPEYRAAYEALEPEFALATGKQPQNIEPFLTMLFEDYAIDRDNIALCYGLQIIAHAKNMQHLESLLVEDNLLFADVVNFMGQLGYRITTKKIKQTTP